MGKIAAGDRFPPIALPDVDGVMRALTHAWADGPALIAVGHADCPTSRLALPYVDRIHRRRRADSSVVVILQEEADGGRSLSAELGLELPVVLDADPYVVGEQLGLEAVPTLVEVDRSGVVSAVVEGFSRADFEALAARFGVAPLFAPADPAPPLKPG